jgi:hypothetical protein
LNPNPKFLEKAFRLSAAEKSGTWYSNQPGKTGRAIEGGEEETSGGGVVSKKN